jgi:histone H3/H4
VAAPLAPTEVSAREGNGWVTVVLMFPRYLMVAGLTVMALKFCTPELKAMDKPDLNKATSIFHDRREIMMQPNCAIIYTVSSALFYSMEFDAIRDQAIFLPNINLHPFMEPERHIIEGYDTLRRFVHVRMDQSPIDDQALDDAITYSGGVFREMARIMRSAIGCARRRKTATIMTEDIEWSATEIRNEYRRILDKNDLAYLQKISEHNRLEYHERLRPLLQLLAILEYRDTENWCDVHPVLRRLVNEQ